MWAQMVNQNSPFYTGTLWEKLGQNGQDTDSNASLAHGWATAPVSAFSSYLLGIQPTGPGYSTWTHRAPARNPELGTGPGAHPVGHPGGVSLAGRQQRQSFELTMSAPAGTAARWRSPNSAPPAIAEDGQVVWAGGAPVGGVSATESNGSVVFANVSGAHTFAEVLDNIAPTTTATLSPGNARRPERLVPRPGAGHAHARPTRTSGVASTQYAVDGGPFQTYSGPFAISTDGAHTVQFWSTDNAGQRGGDEVDHGQGRPERSDVDGDDHARRRRTAGTRRRR